MARFAPHQVDTEARKARRFELGLKPWLYNKVAVLQIPTFAALMEKTIIAEEGSEAMSLYNREQKKSKAEVSVRSEGNRGNRGEKRGNFSGSTQVKQESVKRQAIQCKVCGKNHSGECLKGKFVCYKCGQAGHVAPNCPNPRTNSGCFVCGSAEHRARDCPQRKTETGNVTTRGSGNLAITGPTSVNHPAKATARVYNMTVQDTVAAGGVTPGAIQITYL